MKIHETYISRCIQLAKYGRVAARPNPSVGAVLVYDHKIIGEGCTSPYGGPHAEVNAIAAVKDASLLEKATLYVSLEPCSHYGKTPPCADLIVEKGIKKVVIGTVDPHHKVAGNGIKKLMESGCDVTIGVLEKDCIESNIRFITFHQQQRPYIILKWAQTLDGFIAPAQRDKKAPVWITGTLSRKLTHKWRSEEQAILVGANTVIHDNPSLTTRDWEGASPLRIVIDERDALPKNAAVFNKDASTHTITTSNPAAILKQLYTLNVQSVIIEGGTKTLHSFIQANLWDEARVFHEITRFGSGVKAPLLPEGMLHVHKDQLDDDQLFYYKNTTL